MLKSREKTKKIDVQKNYKKCLKAVKKMKKN